METTTNQADTLQRAILAFSEFKNCKNFMVSWAGAMA